MIRYVLITVFLLFAPSITINHVCAQDNQQSILVNFKHNPNPSENKKLKEAMEKTKSSKIKSLNIKHESLKHLHEIDIEPGQDIESVLETYLSMPEVASAEKVYRIHKTRIPNDLYYSIQWSLPKIQAPLAWDSVTTTPVTVAIIDSGIDSTHPDLQGITIIKGSDWVRTDADPNDEEGHGTFVAGQIGAASNNGIGIAGVVWQSKLFISKVLDEHGDGYVSSLISAIDESITAGVKVINLSLGFASPCSNQASLQTIITAAHNAGITVVVAAGNDNIDASIFSPASCKNTFSVGATTLTDSRATYSNFGTTVDIAAPGGDGSNETTLIVSTIPGGAYALAGGTSMASPYVAGAAALVAGKYPTLSPRLVMQHLSFAADLINTDKYVGKRLNLHRAVTISPSGILYDVDNDNDLDYSDMIISHRHNQFESLYDYSRFSTRL